MLCRGANQGILSLINLHHRDAEDAELQKFDFRKLEIFLCELCTSAVINSPILFFSFRGQEHAD